MSPPRAWARQLLVALALVLSACGSGDDDTVVVLAASSLTDVLPAIGEAFEESTGTTVEFSFAGSSTLREQILEGAPAGVFISANPTIMAELTQVGLITDAVIPVARNTIVIAVPTGNPAGVTGLDSLADASSVVGLCAADVPCGQLAQAVLGDQGVSPEVDTFEPSVRSLLSKIELGEVDAGLVYETDVAASESVETVGVPFDGVGDTIYVAAPLAGAGDAAPGFVEFLVTQTAQELLFNAGFAAP